MCIVPASEGTGLLRGSLCAQPKPNGVPELNYLQCPSASSERQCFKRIRCIQYMYNTLHHTQTYICTQRERHTYIETQTHSQREIALDWLVTVKTINKCIFELCNHIYDFKSQLCC